MQLLNLSQQQQKIIPVGFCRPEANHLQPYMLLKLYHLQEATCFWLLNWIFLTKILCNTTVPLKQLPYQRSKWWLSANTHLPSLAVPWSVNTHHTSHLPGHEQKPHKLLIQSSSQHQYQFPLWEHHLPTFCHLKTPQSCRALWRVHVQCASSAQTNISVTTM